MSVLITGAAGAIGSACVTAFLEAGEIAIAHDLNTQGLEREGVITVGGDLLDPVVLSDLGAVAAENGLTAVVVAHGIAGSAALTDCTPEFVSRVLRINWEAIPRLFSAVESPLRINHGSFIAIASQAALIGEAQNIAYCAAKFAVRGWIEAKAASDSPITFHAVCPGSTNSALLRSAQEKFAAAEGITPEEYYKQRAEPISLGRYGEPEEVAAVSYYLSRPGRRPTVIAVTGGDDLL